MGSSHALNELCYFAWSGFRPGYPAAAFDFRLFFSSSSPTSPGFVRTSSTLPTTPSRRVRPLRGLFRHHIGRELTLMCGLLLLCGAVASPGIGLALIGPTPAARDATAQGNSGSCWVFVIFALNWSVLGSMQGGAYCLVLYCYEIELLG